MFGYSESEILGKPLDVLISDFDSAPGKELIRPGHSSPQQAA